MTRIESAAELRINTHNIAATLSRLGQRSNLGARMHSRELLTLLREVQRGTRSLRDTRANDPDSTEAREFIEQLRTLARALPLILESLQIRKRQLQDALQHFEAASSWALVSQCSLPAPKSPQRR